jgi:hypothetical protein
MSLPIIRQAVPHHQSSDTPAAIEPLKVGLRGAAVSDKVFIYLRLALMTCRD